MHFLIVLQHFLDVFYRESDVFSDELSDVSHLALPLVRLFQIVLLHFLGVEVYNLDSVGAGNFRENVVTLINDFAKESFHFVEL